MVQSGNASARHSHEDRVQHPKQWCGSTQTIWLLGIYPSLFSIVSCSTHDLVFVWGKPHGHNLWENLTSCLCPSGHTELSRGGEHLLHVKHFLNLYAYSANIVSVLVCFLFHCFFLSVDCYPNIQSLPFPLSYQKRWGEGERLIWSLIFSCC